MGHLDLQDHGHIVKWRGRGRPRSPAHLNESIASVPSHVLSSQPCCAMAKAMKYRDVRAALLAQDCTPKQGKGDHEKWYCPCGRPIAVVTQSRTLSPAS